MLNRIRRFIIEHTLPFKEIEYFHPKGNKMPNGINYQRGWFCQECRKNEQKFLIYDDHGDNIALNKGFILAFPISADITFPTHKYYHGHFLDGQYIGADDDQYDKRSTCLYIDDMSLRQALKYAICIASENNIHHVIVRDNETTRIYRGCL